MDDRRVLWDLIKFEIQNKSRKVSIKKAKDRKKLENDLLKVCDELYSKQCDQGLTQDEETDYARYKSELEDMNRYKEQGAYIRSRCEFIEKNEKSNKYFFNKEKEIYDKKTVDKIRKNNEIITEPKEILAELKSFYKNLYTLLILQKLV